jgi:transposase
VNLTLLLRQIRDLDQVLAEYGQHIEELAVTPQYQEAVQSLTCYKGIKNLFALTMIIEIGDIKRFAHPRQLMSWIGMDVREYSSGGKHNRMGITKQGNRYLRTAFIEANQRRPSQHGGLRAAQEAVPACRSARVVTATHAWAGTCRPGARTRGPNCSKLPIAVCGG